MGYNPIIGRGKPLRNHTIGGHTHEASWYSIMFNDWRLVAPVDLSTYEFVPQDLPICQEESHK